MKLTALFAMMLSMASMTFAQEEKGLSPAVEKAASELLWKTIEHLEGRTAPVLPEIKSVQFSNVTDPEEKLKQMDILYKHGFISPDVYHAEREKLTRQN